MTWFAFPIGLQGEAIEAGRDVLFDVDWQGAEQIKHSALRDHVLSVFVLPPSITERNVAPSSSTRQCSSSENT